MLVQIGVVLFIIVTGGYGYYSYRRNKNRAEVRKILHKYMVVNDDELNETNLDYDIEFTQLDKTKEVYL